MPAAVGEDEPTYPAEIRLLGAQTVVFQPQLPPNFAEQARSPALTRAFCYASAFALITHTPALSWVRGNFARKKRLWRMGKDLTRRRKSA
jgi:hypothetical protein